MCVFVCVSRHAMRRLVGDEASDSQPVTVPTRHSGSDSEEEEEEEGYFSTYSHFSIHHEMLSDRVRTEAYQNFITKNPTLFKDKVDIPYHHCYNTVMHCSCHDIMVHDVCRWCWISAVELGSSQCLLLRVEPS